MSKVLLARNGAFSSACVLFLSACSYGPQLETAIIANPSKQLAFYGVRVYAQEKGLLVTGTVRRQTLLFSPIFTSKACSKIGARL